MKLDISKVDKNFLAGSVFEGEKLVWMSVHDEPIEIDGLAVHEGERFCRLPLELLPNCSEGVRILADHTAGGKVRFTLKNSSRLAIRCESLNSGMMSHMPLSGSAGVDIYVNGEFKQAIRPANSEGGFFEGETVKLPLHADIEINLPLYNGIKQLYIGIEKLGRISKPKPYKIEKPIVFYGSSITQGGCASRPGNSYQGFICRALDANQINLGFSGQAKGEEEIAQYIASLEMSAFVLDYDHNAPNVEHLKQTHERFFNIIRQAQPDLPIVIVSRPDCDKDPSDSAKRLAVIRKTYRHAVEAGDKNVWFVHGKKLFGSKDRDACTVDSTHPNDIGFYRMAQVIGATLKKALKHAQEL